MDMPAPFQAERWDPETLDRRPARVPALRCGGNQMGDRLAMTGDRNALAALHRAQELGKMSLGFGCLHTPHLEINWLF